MTKKIIINKNQLKKIRLSEGSQYYNITQDSLGEFHINISKDNLFKYPFIAQYLKRIEMLGRQLDTMYRHLLQLSIGDIINQSNLLDNIKGDFKVLNSYHDNVSQDLDKIYNQLITYVDNIEDINLIDAVVDVNNYDFDLFIGYYITKNNDKLFSLEKIIDGLIGIGSSNLTKLFPNVSTVSI